MIPPQLAAQRFLVGLALGGILGLWYGFLRPLGRRHRHWADLAFMAAVFPAWLWHSFAVCRGDISIWYTLSLFLGCFLEEITAGRLLRPVFDLLWRPVWKLQAFLEKIFEKTAIFLKKIFTSGKK